MLRNTSRLVKLLGILFIIIILFVLKNQISQYISQNSNKPFSSLKKDQIKELIIIQGKKRIKLSKKNSRWSVIMDNQENTADADRINTIVNSIITLKTDDVISTNKSKYRELGIEDNRIEFTVNGKLHQLYIGNSSGLSTNYMRLDNTGDVFITSGFDSVFSPADYRDFNVHFVSNKTNIKSIEIDFDDKKTILLKQGGNWKIDNKNAKKDRVDFYLNDLQTLKSSSIQPKDFIPRGATALIIKIKENNQEKTAEFLINDTESYNLKMTGSNLIYQISAANVASLKKEEKDFVE